MPIEPIHLTLADIKRNALKALDEGRLQAAQEEPGEWCKYLTVRDNGTSVCCVIGASLPPEIANMADNGGISGTGATAGVLSSPNSQCFCIILPDEERDLVFSLQYNHDRLCKSGWAQERRIAELRKLLAD